MEEDYLKEVEKEAEILDPEKGDCLTSEEDIKR